MAGNLAATVAARVDWRNSRRFMVRKMLRGKAMVV
jgi:hypothetical protein